MESGKQQATLRLPFIEIVLILGIFTILSVLIARIFVETDRIRIKAEEVSRAVIETQNIGENIKGQKVDDDFYTQLGAKKEMNGSSYMIYYDKEWKVSETKKDYRILILWEEETTSYGGMDTYKITAYKGENKEEILCDLIVKKVKK